ncbi:MAG TPA: terminase gpA endonuclease subunit [Coriobacteriia bacterium]|nr:terminase gpA endonuclease subunit [Coriobacteriia bacterium]
MTAALAELADQEALYEDVFGPERARMDLELAEDIAALLPERIPDLLVSDWAAEHRILRSGVTPLPGPYRWEVTPYLREIADCLSATSPVQTVVVMKGSRIGATVGIAENWFGYIIDVAPGPTLFMSADKEMAQSVLETRVDAMIESAGLAHKISAQSIKAHGKKTGDTKARKDFPGGFLMAVGPRVSAKLRTYGIRYFYGDEIDDMPAEVGKQGDPLTLGIKRTSDYELTRKILLTSSPTLAETSRVAPAFRRGDQRYYYVPCKHCGHMQPLRWRYERDGETVYALKFERDEMGRLIRESVHYECEKCGGAWTNADKSWFLPRGEWRATAEAEEPNYRSYHVSALYSPIGMMSWEAICREWITAGHDPLKEQAFVNTVLGETWEQRGVSIRPEIIEARKEGYERGTLPKDARPLLVTLGVDVQADRIEAEIVAWGRDFESWSLDHRAFPGDTLDGDSVAWKALAGLLAEERKRGMPRFALVNSGYNTPTVYGFCERQNGVMAVAGNVRLRRGVHEAAAVEEAGQGPRLFYRVNNLPGYTSQRADIDTDHFKTLLRRYLAIGKPSDQWTGPLPGFCHWPVDYGAEFFRQLAAEELVSIKLANGRVTRGWRKIKGRRNEALDCRVYALAAVHVLHGLLAEEARKKQIPIYPWSRFWDELSGLRTPI